MVITEKAFPRGGEVKSAPILPPKLRFGVKTVKVEKPKKVVKKTKTAQKKKDADKGLQAKTALGINRKTIQEGMLLMGFVVKIERTHLIVSLPGKLKGTVQLTAISDAYTQALEKVLESGGDSSEVSQLEDLFQIGQSVCCKVMGFPTKNQYFTLSVNPKDTHAEITHNNLNEGMYLTCALSSWEDHGAIIDMGIKNARCFLARSPTTAGFSVGQLVPCRIESLDKTSSTSNVTVIVAKDQKHREVEMEAIANIDRLMPTSVVTLTLLSNTIRHGLSGKILDGQFEGFINDQHLGAGKKVSEFEIGQEIKATVLYVMPLTKFVYLTLNKFIASEKRLEDGSIHDNVTVLNVQPNGVYLKLDSKSVGLIPVRGMKTNEKSLDDLQRKYGNTVKQVRVLSYDPMEGVYSCTDDVKLIAEKYLSLSDIAVGQLVNCKVREPMKTHGILVKIGQLNGFIYKVHLEKTLLKSRVGSTIKARVLHIDEEKNSVHLTTKKEYIKADPETDLFIHKETIRVGQDFLGMVTNVTPKFIFVEFFNKHTGALKNEAISNMAYPIGTVMRFNISKLNADRIVLTHCKQKAQHKVGDVVKGTVLGTFESGMELEVPGKKGKMSSVWVEKEFTTEFPELVPYICKCYQKGEAISAITITNSLYSVRDVGGFSRTRMLQRAKLLPGKLMRAYVERVEDKNLVVTVPLLDGAVTTKLAYSSVLMKPDVEDKKELFERHQVIYVKVTAPVPKTGNLPLTARLDQTYNGNGFATVNYLKDYFIQLDRVQKPMFQTNKFEWTVGSKIDGEVLKVIKAGGEYEIIFGGKFKGNLKTTSNLKVKDAVKCAIVWVDETGSIFLTNDDRVIDVDKKPKNVAYTNKKERGYIVHRTKYFYVVLLEGARNYVYVPVRLHYNDFQPVLKSDMGKCQVVVMTTRGTDWKIALFAEVYDQMVKLGMEMGEKQKKRPLEESVKDESDSNDSADSDEEENSDVEMVDEDEEALEEPKKKKKKKAEEPEVVVGAKQWKVAAPKMVGNPVVIDENSEMANFWSMDLNNVQSQSADFEMDVDDENDGGKSKRIHVQGPSETDIRNLEEALASSANIPSSTAEFERLVLATPNNSLIWIKFMVFHLQALEVDKARHVFRRALKAINFRWQDDILNVWVAYLNLELRYGSAETFETAFSEALSTNDQFKVTMRTIEILADSAKIAMCKAKATLAMKKFKDRAELWPKIGAAYFKMGLKEEANQLVNKALAVLEKRDHLQVIVEFAKLNRANGQMDVASTLLEQVLTSYPKRTDIWSFYVDMLVKENQVDSARSILERATSQKLPVKKMKTLFKKYLEFEERFGDEKAVAHVKEIASEYVQSQQ